MQDFATVVVFKNTLLLGYLLSYYIILFAIILFFFLTNIRHLRYLTELSFYSNYSTQHLLLVCAITSLAGLPPLFFFYPKLALVAFIVLQGSWGLSLFTLLFIFMGWFIYLNAIRAVSLQGWSFTAPQEMGQRFYSTALTAILITALYFIFFGFFFTQDILLFCSWLFL